MSNYTIAQVSPEDRSMLAWLNTNTPHTIRSNASLNSSISPTAFIVAALDKKRLIGLSYCNIPKGISHTWVIMEKRRRGIGRELFKIKMSLINHNRGFITHALGSGEEAFCKKLGLSDCGIVSIKNGFYNSEFRRFSL